MNNVRLFSPWMLCVFWLLSCAGPPPAPVEDRINQPSGHERTLDGHYRVRRGDSLHAIAFKFGLDWREIARLNGISAPYVIYPDQLLRLRYLTSSSGGASPPGRSGDTSSSSQILGASEPSAASTRVLDEPRSTTRSIGDPPAPARSPAPGEQQAGATVAQTPGTVAPSASVNATQSPAGNRSSSPAGDPARWLWPTEGRLISSYLANDPSRKGIDIGGRTGQSVVATADGQVVYSGSGLIGYGELIIIKHSDRMLSAYAHNSKRLVNEGQEVRAGSQIAEMGTNDRNQAVLHFEIRVKGSPQDPLNFLPRR